MFRWVRLFGQQHLGFWALGLLLFIIQEIPYMVMPLFRMETNPMMAMPPLFYVFVGLWRSNTPLTVCGCVFLVVHFIHVLGNLKAAV